MLKLIQGKHILAEGRKRILDFPIFLISGLVHPLAP
jgi:hypothetical protein